MSNFVELVEDIIAFMYSAIQSGLDLIPLMGANIYIGDLLISLSDFVASSLVLAIIGFVFWIPIKFITIFFRVLS